MCWNNKQTDKKFLPRARDQFLRKDYNKLAETFLNKNFIIFDDKILTEKEQKNVAKILIYLTIIKIRN